MEKLPLFVNCPVSESVLQAFPVVEESGAFYFHTLKLDQDLFSLMIDARPCVAVFSIPDISHRHEICTLLENFRSLREALGYPKRDPTLRTILVAEEKAISLERWHDLGVHEFIIAPILPRALAFKISRHHQRAASSIVPQPYSDQEEVIVVHGFQKTEYEEQKYVSESVETEVPLSEVANPSRGTRQFLGEKHDSPARYSILASIPELTADEGRWEKPAGDRQAPLEAGQDPLWHWAWNQPLSGGARKPEWSFRGERPQYNPKRRTWNLAGEKPMLEMKKKAGPKKLIDSVETNRGREIIVHSSEEPQREIDVLDVKQALSVPLAGRQRTAALGEKRGPSLQGRPATPPSLGTPASKRGTEFSRPEEKSAAATGDAADGGAPHEQGSERREGSNWTQHPSQSQRALQRTLISERERPRDWSVGENSPMESDQAQKGRRGGDSAEAPDALPPGLEEISKQLMAESKPSTEKSASAANPAPQEASRSESGSAATNSSGTPALGSPVAAPGELQPTNPYLDGRGTDSHPLETDKPDLDSERSATSRKKPRAPGRNPSAPSSAKDSDSKSGSTVSAPSSPEDLTTLQRSKLSDSYKIHSDSSAQKPEHDLRLKESSESRKEDPLKLLNKGTDPNTWSMQNLDEKGGLLSKKRHSDPDRNASPAGEAAAEGSAPAEFELFETGEKPSLDPLTEEETLEAALREGKIPDWFSRIPEDERRGKSWYKRFWRRIRALLKQSGE